MYIFTVLKGCDGYVFTCVSLSTGEGISVQGGLCPGSSSVQGGLCAGGVCLGVSVQKVSVKESLCLGGLCPGKGDPRYGNVRVVRIVLECILVFS